MHFDPLINNFPYYKQSFKHRNPHVEFTDNLTTKLIHFSVNIPHISK